MKVKLSQNKNTIQKMTLSKLQINNTLIHYSSPLHKTQNLFMWRLCATMVNVKMQMFVLIKVSLLIRHGAVFYQAEQMFWEVMQLRKEMSNAKLGYYKDELWTEPLLSLERHRLNPAAPWHDGVYQSCQSGFPGATTPHYIYWNRRRRWHESMNCSWRLCSLWRICTMKD